MDKRKLKIALSLAVLIPCVLYAAGIIAQFIININAWKAAGSDYRISPGLPSSQISEVVRALFHFPEGLIAIGVVVLGIAVLCVFGLRIGWGQNGVTDSDRNLTVSNSGSYGTASFMSPKEASACFEVTSAKRTSQDILGMLPDGQVLTLPKDTRLNANLAVCGSSGTGKSRAISRNLVLQAVKRGESVILTDPKSELYESMGEYLRENEYIVKVFNLVEMDHSDSWNCLGEVGSSELMAQTFADIVLQNTSGDSKDAFWYNAELNLLKALVLYVALEMPPEKRNIATVYDLLYTQTEKGLSDMMASISHEHANQYTGELLPPSPASAPYAIFRQSSETVRTSVIIGLGSKLAVLQAQQVRNITSYNEIDLELPGKQKCAYFCIVSDQDIYGVKFVLYDAGKNPIGEYATDQDGYIYIDDELTPGKYYIRELEAAEGYIRDEQYKTVYVEAGKCAQIEWENSAVTGQIQVRKYSADDNLVTGQRAGSALEGAVFEITQARSGKVVGYIVTDARGVAASDPLPLGRYFVTEVSAPKYYQLSSEKMEAEIEYPNQIIKLSAYNKSANLGVTIKKTGNREVQPGQVMSYDFSGIGNTSNVALNSFFWHDRIPTDATRAISVTTGTYNARLYYKVTFKTNLSDYRTLASNLLTSNNYSLSLNAATLGLAQGEYVTDVRFEFGTVPSGFASVVKPTMRVQVLGTVSNGYQIINRADVGGQYLNEWQTAKTTWVTTVRRFNTTPLPKTGY